MASHVDMIGRIETLEAKRGKGTNRHIINRTAYVPLPSSASYEELFEQGAERDESGRPWHRVVIEKLEHDGAYSFKFADPAAGAWDRTVHNFASIVTNQLV